METFWTELLKMLASLVAAAVFYAVLAIAKAVATKLREEAAELQSKRARELAEVLISAAEVKLCDLAGPERMEFVLEKLEELGVLVDDDLVEGVFQQLKASGLLPIVEKCEEGASSDEA